MHPVARLIMQIFQDGRARLSETETETPTPPPKVVQKFSQEMNLLHRSTFILFRLAGYVIRK